MKTLIVISIKGILLLELVHGCVLIYKNGSLVSSDIFLTCQSISWNNICPGDILLYQYIHRALLQTGKRSLCNSVTLGHIQSWAKPIHQELESDSDNFSNLIESTNFIVHDKYPIFIITTYFHFDEIYTLQYLTKSNNFHNSKLTKIYCMSSLKMKSHIKRKNFHKGNSS